MKVPAPLRKPSTAYLAAALIVAGLLIACWFVRAQVPLLDRLDSASLDFQTQWRGHLAPVAEPGVVVLAVDDASLRRLGGFVPDRHAIATAITALHAAQARIVALDILVPDPSTPALDDELAAAMHAAGNVMLPYALVAEAPNPGRGPSAEPGNAVLASAFMRWSDERTARLAAMQPATLQAPLDKLADAAAALGNVSASRDTDGSLPYDLPALPFGGEVYPSLALRIAAQGAGADWHAAEARFGLGIDAGKLHVPLDARSRQWLNYYGPAGTFETISFIDLLDGRIAPERLRGRIVLVGSTALGAGDHLPTPFDASLPGVERLATSIDNQLSGRVLRQPAWTVVAELLAMLTLPLLAAWAIAGWHLRRALPVLALAGLAVIGAAQWLFVRELVIVSLAWPVLALALGSFVALVLRSAFEAARRRRALADLRASEERYALVAQGANDGMWDWDIVEDRVFFSPRWNELMGFEAGQAKNMQAWTIPLDTPAHQAFDEALAEHLAGRSQQFNHVLAFREGGVERWLLARGVATRDELGKAVRMAGSLTDISEQQRLQRQLSYDALHDRLTGLPNRAAFMERLRQAFEGNVAPQRVQAGVVLVDVDDFRELNESEGTQAADAVLRELAQRLSTRGNGQAMSVARLAADRFALLFIAPLLPTAVDATRTAAWAKARFETPFDLGGHTRAISGSAGWAHATQGLETPDDLLAAAEMALAHAKTHARGQLHYFDPAEQLIENSRRWLRENIDRGIAEGQFKLFYQPLVRLHDRKLLGFEALIRWPHPDRGMIMPGEFIPFAEESGQIVELGRWTLREAARQLIAWDAIGFDGEIAVNLSGKQFSEGNIAAEAAAVLGMLGTIEPRRIKLEVTESMAMANPQATAEALQGLAAQGFKISIDDFGTGYSSLAYLHRFPFDTLKVDRSFVIRLAAGREAVEIVRTIVGLALALDKQVLAEGVEQESQAKLLLELGVHVGQGWLFAKALPAVEAEALIRKSVSGA